MLPVTVGERGQGVVGVGAPGVDFYGLAVIGLARLHGERRPGAVSMHDLDLTAIHRGDHIVEIMPMPSGLVPGGKLPLGHPHMGVVDMDMRFGLAHHGASFDACVPPGPGETQTYPQRCRRVRDNVESGILKLTT